MTRKGTQGRNPYEAAYEHGRLDQRHGAPRTDNRYHDRGHSAPYAAAWARGHDDARREEETPMKVTIDLGDGRALEFQHADLSQLGAALVKAVELTVLQEDVLRACRHELTTHHGLHAHDGDPALAWQLDCKTLLDRIDATLPAPDAAYAGDGGGQAQEG